MASSSFSLEDCLDHLRSNDNSLRSVAEEHWNNLKTDAHYLVASLLRVLQGDEEVGRRSLAAVLLRGIALREASVLESLPVDSFDDFRGSILSIMLSEGSNFVRRQIAYAVAPLARLQQWPELLSTLPVLASSHDSEQNVLCFFLIEKLAEYIGQFLIEDRNMSVVISLMEPVFAAPITTDSETTQSAAACAAISLLHELPLEAILEENATQSARQYQQFLDATLSFSVELLQQGLRGDNESLSVISEAFGRLVKTRSVMFRSICAPLLQVVHDACLGEISGNGLGAGVSDDTVKCTLLDVMVDIMTGKETAPFCCNEASRKFCLSLCISKIFQIEVDTPSESYLKEKLPDTDDAFGDENGDEEVSSMLAGSVFSTLIRKWPIEESLSLCSEAIAPLFSDDSSVGTLRAAMFLASILFDLLGCEMQEHLPALVPRLLQLLEHFHPRIRLCALFCFKSIVLSDYDEEKYDGFRSEYHAIFLSSLLKSIQDNMMFPKVSCQGINTLRAFCDPQSCPQQLVLRHSQDILEMSWTILSNWNSYPLILLEECIPLIGNTSIIDAVTFAPFYTNVMSALTSILLEEPAPDDDRLLHQDLKGKCLECCALIGTSVGYDVFLDDATQLLEYMIDLQSEPMTSTTSSVSGGHAFDFSDPIASYLVQSCARIAGVLGPAFEPYLHQVVPILLQHIAQDIQHRVETEDQFSNGGIDAREGGFITIYQRGMGEVRYFNNSYAMKEKELSLRSLYQYVLDIPRLMAPFVEDIVSAVTSISPLNCSSDNDTSSLNIIGAIISDSCKLLVRFSPPNIKLDRVVGEATTWLHLALQDSYKMSVEYSQVEMAAVAVDNIRLTLQILADENFTGGALCQLSHDTARIIFMDLRDHSLLWLSRKYEETVVSVLRSEGEELEDDMWLGLTDALGYLLKSLTLVDSSHLFQDDVMPFMMPLMSSGEMSIPLLSMIISVLTEAVEAYAHNSPLCNSVTDALEPYLFQYNDHEDLRILCMYGMGACSLHSSSDSTWISNIDRPSSMLQEYLQMVSAEEVGDDNDELKGTIVSALFKVAVAQAKPTALLVEVLHDLMPLGCFPYEARECHTLLIDLMIAEDIRLTGHNGENLPALFAIIAQLAFVYVEAMSVLSASSPLISAEDSSSCVGSDNDDFWNEQIVPENFNMKVRNLFSLGEGKGTVCGFERVNVLSLLQSLPTEQHEALQSLI